MKSKNNKEWGRSIQFNFAYKVSSFECRDAVVPLNFLALDLQGFDLLEFDLHILDHCELSRHDMGLFPLMFPIS